MPVFIIFTLVNFISFSSTMIRYILKDIFQFELYKVKKGMTKISFETVAPPSSRQYNYAFGV